MQEEREGVYAQSRYPHYRAAAVQARQAGARPKAMKIARLPIRQGPYWWPSTQANLQMRSGRSGCRSLWTLRAERLGVRQRGTGSGASPGRPIRIEARAGAGLESVRYILLLEAGCRIEPDTIKFLLRALERTGAGEAIVIMTTGRAIGRGWMRK
jgi:hypothetical protein